MASALASPAGIAQTKSPPRRIAFLFYASRQAAYDTGRYPAFVEGLRSVGLVEGRDVEILARYADGDGARVVAMVDEALRSRPEVIVATGSPVYRALRDAKGDVPVVVTVGPDPVAVGLAMSIARPGGRFTGLTDAAESLIPKQLELMRAAVPRLSTIGTMLNPTNDSHRPQAQRLAAIAREAGLGFAASEASTTAAVPGALGALAKAGARAVILFGDTFYTQVFATIAQSAIEHRLATIYIVPQFSEAGGLMSYGPDLTENFRRAARFVDRILKGAKPGDLPFEHPSTYQLVVNLRTAKALGLALPSSLAARADRVIE
ncbi:MAG: ABC transporter substrate-binding protein [Vicinamibacteria bacterium]